MNQLDADKLMKMALSAIQQGDSVKAEKILTHILKNNRDHLDAWLLLADTAKQPRHRMASLKQVLRINPNHSIARRRLAEYQSRGKKITPTKKPESASETTWSKKRKITGNIVFIALLLVTCCCVPYVYLFWMIEPGRRGFTEYRGFGIKSVHNLRGYCGSPAYFAFFSQIR